MVRYITKKISSKLIKSLDGSIDKEIVRWLELKVL